MIGSPLCVSVPVHGHVRGHRSVQGGGWFGVRKCSRCKFLVWEDPYQDDSEPERKMIKEEVGGGGGERERERTPTPQIWTILYYAFPMYAL